MAKYVLIHGAGDVGWYWHLVERELRSRGHEVVVTDLPVDDDDAHLSDNADVVVDAIGDGREDVVVVAQSYGGYVAPIVCDRVPARLLVLVAGMIPAPGESAEQMFTNTRFGEADRPPGEWDDLAIFYHDVPRPLAEEALSKGRRQSETTSGEPFPLPAWPDVPTRFILCRDDRLFPAEWLRGLVRERLGIEPDALDSGHTPALSHPVELTDLLERIRAETFEVGTAGPLRPPGSRATRPRR
jgi:pimeloyl-ACP methyl ester carboxylesterase